MISAQLIVFVVFLISSSIVAANNNQYEVQNNFPSRYQWETNMGYCGEVSLIVSGLALGQYISQYDSRIAACDTKSQARCEMLLGVNDQTAVSVMHLQSSEWGTVQERSTNDFLLWVKQNVILGYPVTIGVFMNYNTFYNDQSPSAGDADYDHIVPVVGISSKSPLTDTTYHGDDIIYFSDNGLYGTKANTPYVFNYTFDQFQKTRAGANTKNGDVYSLPNTGSNYGIVITGINDANKETVPVKVDTDVNYEDPEMKEGSDTRPASMAITLTISISNLIPNVKYNLYRYNSLASVPDSGFNSKPGSAYESWVIESTTTTYQMTKKIQSDEVAAFRCVKA